MDGVDRQVAAIVESKVVAVLESIGSEMAEQRESWVMVMQTRRAAGADAQAREAAIRSRTWAAAREMVRPAF